jgi:hypothetical protein
MSEPKLVKLARWLNDYIWEFLEIAVGGLYLVIGILYEHGEKTFHEIKFETIGFYLVPIALFLNTFIGYRLIKKSESISAYREQNEHLSQKVQSYENEIEDLYATTFDLFNWQLEIISHKIRLTANERISIYKYSESRFILIGRYSINTTYKKVRDKIYPDDEGFFKNVWNSDSGELYIDDLPEYSEDRQQRELYINAVRQYCTIGKRRLDAIRMKCRNYYLKVLTDVNDRNRIAVIVIESLQVNRLPKQDIDFILNDERERLIFFTEKMKTKPDGISLATQTGF